MWSDALGEDPLTDRAEDRGFLKSLLRQMWPTSARGSAAALHPCVPTNRYGVWAGAGRRFCPDPTAWRATTESSPATYHIPLNAGSVFAPGLRYAPVLLRSSWTSLLGIEATLSDTDGVQWEWSHAGGGGDSGGSGSGVSGGGSSVGGGGGDDSASDESKWVDVSGEGEEGEDGEDGGDGFEGDGDGDGNGDGDGDGKGNEDGEEEEGETTAASSDRSKFGRRRLPGRRLGRRRLLKGGSWGGGASGGASHRNRGGLFNRRSRFRSGFQRRRWFGRNGAGRWGRGRRNGAPFTTTTPSPDAEEDDEQIIQVHAGSRNPFDAFHAGLEGPSMGGTYGGMFGDRTRFVDLGLGNDCADRDNGGCSLVVVNMTEDRFTAPAFSTFKDGAAWWGGGADRVRSADEWAGGDGGDAAPKKRFLPVATDSPKDGFAALQISSVDLR